MAERRMFSKKIIDTDLFLDMPTSSRLLYYDLSMRADDEGFVSSPKKIVRMTGSSEDDLKLLIAKQFLIPFDSGVCVIKDWKIHNYIRKDRIRPTIYTEERARLDVDENGSYVICQSDVSHLTDKCPHRLGKDRIGKVRLEEDRGTGENPPTAPPMPYDEIKNLYLDNCKSFPRINKLSDARKKAIKARIASGYTVDDFKNLFQMAESSEFLKGANNRNWQATFDWLIKDANMAKVLDGNYKDKQPSYSRSSAKKETSYDIEEFERLALQNTPSVESRRGEEDG